jgi:hypothetical protein
VTAHPAALVLADHQVRPHAWPRSIAGMPVTGVIVTCRCNDWSGWDYDHPAHLVDALDRAGLLAAGTPPETTDHEGPRREGRQEDDMSEPNLYTCPRCGWTIGLPDDDLAGDEGAVAQRTAHDCAPGV